MLRSKVGKALDRHILRNWISIYKIVFSVHIKNQYIYKISCPCLLILISRIWIILTHPWAALERHQWMLFNAFLIAATGSVLPKPNLLAHPHLKLVRKPCYATLSKPRSFSLIFRPPAQLHWHENCMGQPYLSCPTATPRGGSLGTQGACGPLLVAENERCGSLKRMISDSLPENEGKEAWSSLAG